MRCLILLLFFITSTAQAGFIEVSATGSLRTNKIDENNQSETRSLTGSIAYYFLENSALELSYTEGYVDTEGVSYVGSTAVPYEQVVNFQMLGISFILSMGGKTSILRPYVKAGVASQTKEIEFKSSGSDTYKEETDGTFATYGIGFKLQISKNWAFKAGYDAWKGPLNEDDGETKQTDDAVRAGISFIF